MSPNGRLSVVLFKLRNQLFAGAIRLDRGEDDRLDLPGPSSARMASVFRAFGAVWRLEKGWSFSHRFGCLRPALGWDMQCCSCVLEQLTGSTGRHGWATSIGLAVASGR